MNHKAAGGTLDSNEMDRREFVRRSLVMGVAASAFAVLPSCSGENQPQSERIVKRRGFRPGPYNVVVVVLDDTHPSLWPKMTWLQSRLAPGATNWVRFSNASLDSPICGPSRATLLSGMAERHHRVSTNDLTVIEAFHEPLRDKLVGPTMQAAGYFTAYAGKYINEYPWRFGSRAASDSAPNEEYVPPGWHDWYCLTSNVKSRPAKEQQARYDKYWVNDNRTLVLADNGDKWRNDDQVGATPRARANRQGDTSYLTDRLSLRVGQVIERAKEPFISIVGHLAPHEASGRGTTAVRLAVPASRHAKLSFPGPTIAGSESFGEPDLSTKPAWLRATAGGEGRFDAERRGALVNQQVVGWRTVQSVDEALYDLEEHLREAAILDRTVIIVYSDNGLCMGEHRQQGKVRPYEESIHTDIWVRHPDVGASRTDDALVSHLDIVPTIHEITGATPLIPPDGTSFLPVLDGRALSASFRSDLIVTMSNRSADACPAYRLVRTYDGWKYIEYEEWSKNDAVFPAEAEMYDRTNDPFELRNLAASRDPAHVAKRTELGERLRLLTL